MGSWKMWLGSCYGELLMMFLASWTRSDEALGDNATILRKSMKKFQNTTNGEYFCSPFLPCGITGETGTSTL